jgi:hypothetical protein
LRPGIRCVSALSLLALIALWPAAGCDVFSNPLAIAIDVPDNSVDADSDGFSLPQDLFQIESAKVSSGIWDFTVVRTDGGSLDNLKFEWDSDIAGDAPREGQTQRFAFPYTGDFDVTLTIMAADGTKLFDLSEVVSIMALPNFPPIARIVGAGTGITVHSGGLGVPRWFRELRRTRRSVRLHLAVGRG